LAWSTECVMKWEHINGTKDAKTTMRRIDKRFGEKIYGSIYTNGAV